MLRHPVGDHSGKVKSTPKVWRETLLVVIAIQEVWKEMEFVTVADCGTHVMPSDNDMGNRSIKY